MPKIKTKEQLRIEELEARTKYQAQLLAANHIVSYDDSVPHPDFEAECAKFRTVCAEIKEFLGLDEFYGGYDELDKYIERPELLTPEGQALKDKLNLYDSSCNHEAGKIGLPSPEWFYKCWELA